MIPALIALSVAAPVQTGAAVQPPTARTILDRVIEAQGGERWAKVRTLYLSGTSTFYGVDGPQPRVVADDYRMWRVFDQNRSASHVADGKVRIIERAGDRLLFTVGYDGKTTWNQSGVVPEAEANKLWASNFGFGIIRHATDPGFMAQRVADDSLDGHPLYVIRLTDPKGGVTVFGIDQKSYAIRRMGFATPRGWHVRTYDDFIRLEPSHWLQARKVTLYYDGVKQNEVIWEKTVVDGPIDDAVFSWSDGHPVTPPKPAP